MIECVDDFTMGLVIMNSIKLRTAKLVLSSDVQNYVNESKELKP